MNANNEFGRIPEVILYNILKYMIGYTEENSKIDNKNFNLLWRIFGGDECYPQPKMGNLNLYEQSLELFKGDEANRGITVSVGYNLQRVETGEPSIHILLPSENQDSSSIGMGAGYYGNFVDETDGVGLTSLSIDSAATYNLMITTDNVNEIMIIYHWLKSCSLSFSTQFELEGFKNVKIGGNDLQFNDELVPPNIFHRNFNLSFSYEVIGLDLFSEQALMIGKDFKVCGKIESAKGKIESEKGDGRNIVRL